MTVSCLACRRSVDLREASCPWCGEPVTDFVRKYQGTRLHGNYEITGRLGAGGMSEVYKARHLHLQTDRVIKVLRPSADAAAARARFLREARTAQTIRHPNVAAFYELSELPDGSYYIVTEFIDGVTLRAFMREHGPLPVDRVIDLSVQVLRGLQAIHAAGFVHRDISPDNIMISTGASGHPLARIIDLGIAKPAVEEEEPLTATGLFLGKFKYASPEQLGMLGDGDRIDGRADLYSLGVVMYEMVTGHAPFLASTPEQYVYKHLHEQPAPIPDASQVAPAILRALAKNRGDRFATAAEFAAALETGLGEDVTAIPQTITVSPPHPRHPLRLFWFTLAGLLVFAAFGLWQITTPEWTTAGILNSIPPGTAETTESPPPLPELVDDPAVYRFGVPSEGFEPAGGAIAQRAREAVAKSFGASPDAVTVLKKELPFYESGITLLYALNRATSPPSRSFLMQDGSLMTPIATNEAIYELNERLSFRPSRDNAADYVRFFFSVVRGRHGRFLIVEGSGDIRWRPDAPQDARVAAQFVTRPLALQPPTPDGKIEFVAVIPPLPVAQP